MAALALGLAGGLIGGPAGFLIGSLIGNLLFPQKVQGPRLQDLKLHTSSYGQMTPIVYGTMRVAGNVIDEQQLLSEHEQDSGGKGGPEVQSFTYTASFASRLCEGPIAGIGKVWANGRTIYDYLNPKGDAPPLTLYLGTEDQLPDPTLETIHGAGNVPAYRGIAYVVFTDLLLTDYGNAIPSLEFEVYTKAGDIPIRVSTFSPGQYSPTGTLNAVTYNPDASEISVGSYYTGSSGGHPALSYSEHFYTLDGTEVGIPIVDQPLSGAGFNPVMVASNINLAYYGTGGWYSHGNAAPTPALAPGVNAPFGKGIAQDGYLFCQGDIGATIQRWTIDSSTECPISDAPDIEISSPAGSSISFGTSDVKKIYVHQSTTGNIWEYDENLILTNSWTASNFPSGFNPNQINGNNFMRYRNLFVFSYNGLGFSKMNLVSIGAGGVLTLYAQPRNTSNLPDYDFAAGPVIQLYGGHVLGIDGVTLLDPGIVAPILGDIVADISARTNLLTEDQYDVSALTDTVDGYLITNQQEARENIGPLRQAWFFDAVERDDQIVFVKRGGASVVSIPEDDLAAYVDGDQEPAIVETVRDQETDLPAIVTLSYVNKAADYQTGAQISQRQTTLSQMAVDVQLQISMTDEKAKSVADTLLLSPWEERDKKKFFTARKYGKYEPTDVVTVEDKTLRVVGKSEVRAGVIEWDAVDSLAAVYLKSGGGAGKSLGFTPSPPTPTTANAPTNLVLLDMPLATDADVQDGYYVGMDSATGWSGGALYESMDGGTTYGSVFSESTSQVLGTTSDALLDFTGGNVFDETNSVTVVTDGGQLSSATADAVLNGANLAAIGSEYVQFKNATLTSTDTYVLSGLLRGRRGTEWATGSHAEGERFMLMSGAGRVSQPRSEIGITRSFKPVTFGGSVSGATAVPFANGGASIKPYAPVLLGGGVDGSGNVTLNWTLRTRIGGAWSPYVDVAQPDSTNCVVQTWNSDYTKCARVIENVTSGTVYTAAQQTTDFGATQQTIYFTVAQVGAAGIGYQARGVAPGAGASNSDPLTPVSPHQSGTSGSPAPSSLPQLNLSMGWANVRKLSSSVGTFNCANIVVASFTTPAATADGVIGHIDAAEWVDQETIRTACLSTVAGDFSGTVLGRYSRVVSVSPSVHFAVGTSIDGYPSLSPSTTYYFNIKNDDGNGVCTCLSGSCGIFVELQKPHGL